MMNNHKKGYLGNQNLRAPGEKISMSEEEFERVRVEYEKCKNDPIYFAENYIKIVHVDKGLINLDMYDYQKEITEKITNQRRVVVLTARQAGKTTTAVAAILHYVIFNNHKEVGILANKGAGAVEVLSRIRLAYEALPKWLQKGVVKWNEGDISLENGCKVRTGTTTSSSIRGKSLSFLYVDECIGGQSKVCVEIGDSYYYTEIENLINIDESDFMKVKDTCSIQFTKQQI